MQQDTQDQLELLRRRVARINQKYAPENARSSSNRFWNRLHPVPAPVEPNPESKLFVEEYLSGAEVENELGKHFETEKLYERHKRYGSVDISSLAELPDDLLCAMTQGDSGVAPPARWAFLDTETTGLAGGSGTYAFLIGIGSICADGFRVRQFFMRDYDEEASVLAAVSAHLEQFDILVTYNGKSYDQPLLETRYRLARQKPPFARLRHVDLLFSARRLWKLRFESCRLVELENRVLGVEREGDLPGELIPYVYFEYLRTREAFRVVPILHHNVMDIATLACLSSIVPWAFRSPREYQCAHGAELIGLARWLIQCEQTGDAADLLRQAVATGLPDELTFRALRDLALLEKKRGCPDAAVPLWVELAGIANAFRVQAYEELAKHYEHAERNAGMALEMTRSALAIESSDELRKRERRLSKRATAPRARRLL